ncbi:hypothetical protein [Corallococcus aberystwythensis]|uniref:PNPLA domain-containing protein n=1 Tax=Corallococcus aberystwythensis TaxID=2316722 RepID=A0A3A8Q9M6_9BACT|nr:hypothetical protein [Corallococcus aberystwythensis]RKH62915.1 hypothetical protein D7W81_21300 [Corallococcus aberystwythensis]
MEPKEAKGLGIQGLVELELKAMEGSALTSQTRTDDSREPAWIEHPSRSLFGLALSGGGIRSATFNLGLLQGLAKLELLGTFDYLATVSGGGYIGGFWSAWLRRNGHAAGQDPGPCRGADPLFPRKPEAPCMGEPCAIRHLREFSNFLRPRSGLLNSDTGRIVASVSSAIIPSLLAALSLLVLGVLAWVGLAWAALLPGRVAWPGGFARGLPWLLLFVPPLWAWRRKRLEARLAACAGLLGALCLRGGLLLLFVLTAVELTQGEWWWRRRELAQPGEDRLSAEGSGAYLLAAVCAVGLTVGFGGLFAPAASAPDVSGWRVLRALFTPAVAWGAAAGALILGRFLFSNLGRGSGQPSWMYGFERAISRLLTSAALWAGMASCWLAGAWLQRKLSGSPLSTVGLATFISSLMAVLARGQKLISHQPSRPALPGKRERWIPVSLRLLASAIAVLLLVGVVALVIQARLHGWLTWLFVVAAAATLATLLCFETTRVGLHNFYRARLARAYLGATSPGGGAARLSGARKGDDLLLSELAVPGTPLRPLHLICCAANDLRPPDPLSNLERGAQSAVLSPVGMSVADEAHVWHPAGTRRRNGGAPTLAAAMTASGAAFNSNMGGHSKRLGSAVTFLMSAFNLRLGLWWPHPTRGRQRRWFEALPIGLPFYKELFGMSRAQDRDVHLSDGGHFENLSLYELVRRHCRYILVSDCGMDPDVACDDFGNAVRRVREDFGVEIRIDLSPLHPGPNGRARQRMVAGDIHYPTGDAGVLLMIKPTLTGDEPADVAQYKARNAAFPHESTGDQFYDEAQWESYRRLGEHVVETAFLPVTSQPDWRMLEEGTRGAALFAWARREWLPLPAGYSDRFARLASRAAEIDALLHAAGTHRLLREVFEEEVFVAGLSREQGDGVRELAARPEALDITGSLWASRQALLFMEEVFLREDLAQEYNHPAYLGLMNYFARWAHAPLFRMWWPLLKALYPQRFTRFLETQFGLAPRRRAEPHVELERDSPAPTGLAMSRWTQERGRLQLTDGARLLSFVHPVRYGDRDVPIQLAQVRVYIQEAWTDGGLAAWDASDFFVPPGFWGSGIGEAFLRALVRFPEWGNGQRHLGPDTRVSRLAVHLHGSTNASASEMKREADEAVLYRSSGFEEPDGTERDKLYAMRRSSWGRRGQPGDYQCEGGKCPCLWLVRSVAASPGA